MSTVYKNGNPENQEQEDLISMAPENEEDFTPKFNFESETQAEKEKQEKRNKLFKMGVILTICFLLLNFVLVVIAMHRTSENSSSSPFSTGKLEALKNGNRELKKSQEELKEQFETLSQKLEELENNTSLNYDPHSITSCSVAMEKLSSPRSKKQTIYPHGNRTSVEVLCDFETDGGGWTIIQKRTSGPREEFQKNWNEYANGFGSLDKNFWLGLENIHTLTKNRDQELRIELEDFQGQKRYAKYSNFSISDASDFYRLSLSGFSSNSTAGDSMTDQNYQTLNGMRFSTKDKDNDLWSGGNCALDYGGGGWWFDQCSRSRLNSLYFEKGETVQSFKGLRWASWIDPDSSLDKTEMKIRHRKSQ